jgi:hypothetical protein
LVTSKLLDILPKVNVQLPRKEWSKKEEKDRHKVDFSRGKTQIQTRTY